MKYKIIRIYRDESDLNFVLRFPKGKTITDIEDVIFLVKELDADPLDQNLIEKLLSDSKITLTDLDVAQVSFEVEDYENITIDKLYRAALFCKWQGNTDFDENVERLFDFQAVQNFHNDL
jgi:hypothetical protein